jgi:putative redox protein
MRRVNVRWLGDYRTEIEVRGVHHLQGDETPQYGGQDTGPMPTEFLLIALGDCMCLAVAHVARKRQIPLTQILVEVGAEKDMQAFRFQDMFVTIHADLPQDRLEDLIERARHYCFVSNTISRGCNIHYAGTSIVEPTSEASS